MTATKTTTQSRQLQQQPPAVQLGKFLFHSAAAAGMIYSYISIAGVMGKLTILQYGGDWQYLTVLGLLVSVATMALSAINDILPNRREPAIWSKLTPAIYATKRVLALAAMPVEITISAIYWPIIIVAPALMVPPSPDFVPSADNPVISAPLVFLPLWMDLGLHALPAIALVIDFFFLERKYRPPTSTRTAALVAAGFGVSYALWVEHCASINGKFPYPFLTMMEREQRNYVYAGASAFALLVFWGLNALHK